MAKEDHIHHIQFLRFLTEKNNYPSFPLILSFFSWLLKQTLQWKNFHAYPLKDVWETKKKKNEKKIVKKCGNQQY